MCSHLSRTLIAPVTSYVLCHRDPAFRWKIRFKLSSEAHNSIWPTTREMAGCWSPGSQRGMHQMSLVAHHSTLPVYPKSPQSPMGGVTAQVVQD